jgi:maltooligosyltrehalose synthase
MKKSIKESKMHTNWTEPNEEYENITNEFVANVRGTLLLYSLIYLLKGDEKSGIFR